MNQVTRDYIKHAAKLTALLQAPKRNTRMHGSSKKSLEWLREF